MLTVGTRATCLVTFLSSCAIVIAAASCGSDSGGEGAGSNGSDHDSGPAGAAGAAPDASDTGAGTGGTSTEDASPDAAEAGSAGSAGSVSNLIAGLENDDFTVQEGAFLLPDLSSCCDEGKSCSGNNPSSPYGTFQLPPAPEQTAINPNADAQGWSQVWRLREDEAVVYVGVTPPKARYFGFTPYLFDRDLGDPERHIAFASLSETLNNGVIGVDSSAGGGVFDRPVVIVAAANAETDARVRGALRAAGWPEEAINTIVIDPAKSQFGLEEEADTFGLLFRVAVFENEAEGEQYLAALPGTVLRVTPNTALPASPLPSPTVRPKDTSHDESGLSSSLNQLGAAIVAAYPDYDAKHLVVTEGTPDPDACIQGTSVCAGDNRDTIYPSILPRVLFQQDTDFYVAYGVNHAMSGKASYANASVYAMHHLVGVASVTDAQYAGSATDYVPSGPNTDQLYAWKIARDCGTDPHCLSVPDAGCPTGVQTGELGAIAFRLYLEPTTHTAADPSTVILDRIIRFEAN